LRQQYCWICIDIFRCEIQILLSFLKVLTARESGLFERYSR
jgi:hypothetical protein